MAFVPAVPEAAAAGITLGEVLIALAAMLGWAICFGMLFAWNYTLGYLLNVLADALDFSVLHVHVDLGGPVRALDNSVKHALSAGVSTFDHAMGLFFHWAGVMLAWMVNFAAASAQDTLRFAEWLTNAHLPKWLRAAIYATFPPALIARLVRAAIDAHLPHVGRVVITKVYEKVVTKTVAAAHALAHPGTIALPGIRKEIAGLTKRNLRISKRLHRVEGLFAAGVMAAVLANALGVATKCLRSGNIAKTARRICGLDPSLLESLLLDTLAIVGVVSVVQFAEALQEVEQEAIGILGATVKEWPG